MKINEIITKELLERYQYRVRPAVKRYVHRPIRKPAQTTPKAINRPAPKTQLVINRRPAPNTQTTGLNPKINMLDGPNFQLNNRNIKPEYTDKEIQLAMKSRNNEKRSF